MAQENEHIRKLIAARGREVEQRRNIADTLAQAYERGETERMREVFINLQHDRTHRAGHPTREDVGRRFLEPQVRTLRPQLFSFVVPILPLRSVE
jgi:hypothetical protein